jgi:hypothetical protein
MSDRKSRPLPLAVFVGALLSTSVVLAQGGTVLSRLPESGIVTAAYRANDVDYLRPYPYPYPYGYSQKALRIYARWKRDLEEQEYKAEGRYWRAQRKYDNRVYRAERKYDRSLYGY